MASATRESWSGTYVELAGALDVIFENGPISYEADFDDTTDITHICGTLQDGILRMMKTVPRHNARWKTLKNAILYMMQQNTWQDPPEDHAERKSIAEDQATLIRCI